VGVVTKGKKAGWMQRLRYVTKVMGHGLRGLGDSLNFYTLC